MRYQCVFSPDASCTHLPELSGTVSFPLQSLTSQFAVDSLSTCRRASTASSLFFGFLRDKHWVLQTCLTLIFRVNTSAVRIECMRWLSFPIPHRLGMVFEIDGKQIFCLSKVPRRKPETSSWRHVGAECVQKKAVLVLLNCLQCWSAKKLGWFYAHFLSLLHRLAGMKLGRLIKSLMHHL